MARRKPTQTAAFNLAALIEGCKTEPFMYFKQELLAEALAAGYVEVNEAVKNDANEVAVRPTEKGIASMSQNTTAAPAAAAKSAYAIEDNVPLAAVTGRGRTSETYPFDQLSIGQSFFVPNTDEKPNIAKSLASTVSSATRRYSEEIAGETRKDRKGNVVPALKVLRKFVVRSVDGGARVWRVALDSTEE